MYPGPAFVKLTLTLYFSAVYSSLDVPIYSITRYNGLKRYVTQDTFFFSPTCIPPEQYGTHGEEAPARIT